MKGTTEGAETRNGKILRSGLLSRMWIAAAPNLKSDSLIACLPPTAGHLLVCDDSPNFDIDPSRFDYSNSKLTGPDEFGFAK